MSVRRYEKPTGDMLLFAEVSGVPQLQVVLVTSTEVLNRQVERCGLVYVHVWDEGRWLGLSGVTNMSPARL